MNAQPKLPWSLIRIVLMDAQPLQTHQRSKREASQEVVIGPQVERYDITRNISMP